METIQYYSIAGWEPMIVPVYLLIGYLVNSVVKVPSKPKHAVIQ